MGRGVITQLRDPVSSSNNHFEPLVQLIGGIQPCSTFILTSQTAKIWCGGLITLRKESSAHDCVWGCDLRILQNYHMQVITYVQIKIFLHGNPLGFDILRTTGSAQGPRRILK